MDSAAAVASDMSAIWAALQAEPQRSAPPSSLRRLMHTTKEDDDDEDEEEEEEEEEEDDSMEDDELAPVVPHRVGGGLLPSSFYSTTTALPDVSGGMPSFLLAPPKSSFGSTTVSSSSELFLDDILRSHDESFGVHDDPAGAAGTGTEAGTRLTAERLSQLEDNYERKKKRAKINRRDLNSRFQELMELLQLKEDRKLNRAKVLEKAIEQLHKLSNELKTAKHQLQLSQQQQQRGSSGVIATNSLGMVSLAPPSFAAAAASFSSVGRGSSGQLHMPLPLPQWTAGAAGVMPPSALGMASPMMWMPLMPTSQRSSRSTSARAKSGSARTKTAKSVGVSMQTQTSPALQPTPTSTTAPAPALVPAASVAVASEMTVRRPGLKRARESEAAVAAQSLTWAAQEIPALLELCDAWTLRQLMGASRDLRTAALRGALWKRLCERRWRLDGPQVSPCLVAAAAPSGEDPYSTWKRLDAANEMPRCFCVTGSAFHFASGREDAVGIWASLVRRSNGRTTRTVLVEGKAVVRQVVELNVLIQNLHACASMRLTDQLRVMPETASSSSIHAFQLLTADSRAHLMPHLVTVNDVPSGAASVDAVELFHGDFCVLSVFVECHGLDLEQQFLERVDGVAMQCQFWANGQEVETVDVAARAHASKLALIAETYSGKAV